MTKFYILILILAIFLLFPKNTELYDVAKEYGSGEYFFSVRYAEECVDELDFVQVVRNGEENIISCPLYMAKEVKSQIKGEIRGESFRIKGGEGDTGYILDKLGAKVVSEQRVDEIRTKYLYSGKIGDRGLDVGGKRVNLQIAEANGYITVGFPVILISY